MLGTVFFLLPTVIFFRFSPSAGQLSVTDIHVIPGAIAIVNTRVNANECECGGTRRASSLRDEQEWEGAVRGTFFIFRPFFPANNCTLGNMLEITTKGCGTKQCDSLETWGVWFWEVQAWEGRSLAGDRRAAFPPLPFPLSAT